MILAGEMRAFVNFFVEAAELRFDVSAHGDEFFVLRRHLLDLLPRVTQLLRTERRRISLLHVADLKPNSITLSGSKLVGDQL